MRMYTRWAEQHKYPVEVFDTSYAEEAGLKSATFAIHAPYAYGTLSVEAGTHRLVRISPFDNQGRRQTSFAAVEVVPVLEQTDEIEIPDEEIRVDVYRSGGPGGQSVNTTDSAVRLTHIPTGIVVSCQNEKCQLQNKASAMVVLKAKLLALKKAEEKAQLDELRGDVAGLVGRPDAQLRAEPVPDRQGPAHRLRGRQPAGGLRRRHRRLPRGRHPLAPRRRRRPPPDRGPSRKRVPVHGIELAYDESGDRDAPPAVLLHALGEAAEDWADLAPRLAADHRVLALDLRGHGDSSWPGEYSAALMADDVVAALDALDVRDAVLVGHSLGGVVAFRIAAARPDLVSLLVVEDVCPPYDRERPLPQRPEGVELPFDWDVIPAIAAESGVTDRAAWDALASIEAPTLLDRRRPHQPRARGATRRGGRTDPGLHPGHPRRRSPRAPRRARAVRRASCSAG